MEYVFHQHGTQLQANYRQIARYFPIRMDAVESRSFARSTAAEAVHALNVSLHRIHLLGPQQDKIGERLCVMSLWLVGVIPLILASFIQTIWKKHPDFGHRENR